MVPVSQGLRTNRHLVHVKAHRTIPTCGNHSTKAGYWYSRPLASACVRLSCIYVGISPLFSDHTGSSHVLPLWLLGHATPKASSGHEPEEPFHGAGPRPGCPVLLSANSSRGVRGSLGVRMRVILASASIIAKSAATSWMPGVRTGVGIASIASRCPLGSWAGVGVGVEGTGVNEEAWPMDSFPYQQEHLLR